MQATGGMDSARARAEGGGPGARVHAPIKVLIADDTKTNRLTLGVALDKQGFQVISAADGRAAVAAFARERPDVVLMDALMPGMDGFQATRRIKALAGDRFVPVIFVTALTDEASLVRCIECGGDDVLAKPVCAAILKAKIDALLRIRDRFPAPAGTRP